jgi:TRAP-type C4-dicarboxylate transport system substrate-binding protein
MQLRKRFAVALGVLALAAGVAATGAVSADTISIGTLAPKNSPWGKVFETWVKAVEQKSGGKLELKFFYNGQQGDEKAAVAKIRAGQLDGAAVTAVGLSDVYKPILALQSPGLFTNWGKLDSVRNQMLAEFQEGMKGNGFVLAGVGDVGAARTMSKGKAIKAPEDLKSMKVYAWQDDIIAPVTAGVIGYTPVLSSVPGLLPALSSGRINVITVPSLAATQLQWWSHLDHVNAHVAGLGIGGLVLSTKSLDKLPGDLREIMMSTGKKAGEMLTERIRKEDDKAYEMIKGRMTVVNLSAAEVARWEEIFKQIRARLGQTTFSGALMKKLEGLAGK